MQNIRPPGPPQYHQPQFMPNQAAPFYYPGAMPQGIPQSIPPMAFFAQHQHHGVPVTPHLMQYAPQHHMTQMQSQMLPQPQQPPPQQQHQPQQPPGQIPGSQPRPPPTPTPPNQGQPQMSLPQLVNPTIPGAMAPQYALPYSQAPIPPVVASRAPSQKRRSHAIQIVDPNTLSVINPLEAKSAEDQSATEVTNIRF